MRSSIVIAAALLGAIGAASLPAAAQEAQVASDKEAAAYAAAIQRHVNAYRARDLDAFTATFAPDAVVVANGIRAQGRREIRAFYSVNFSPDAPTIRINASYMDGGQLYLETAYVLSDGQEMCCSSAYYTVQNGLITRLDVTG